MALAPPILEQTRDRFERTTIETISEIVADSAQRIERYRQDSNLLNQGIFYGNEYFNALKELGQRKRLDFFVNKGSFYHGYVPSKYFKMIESSSSPSGYLGFRFIIKAGIKPSEALKALREGITFIGCGETCQIAWLEAIQDVLGVEKFNALYAADSSTPLTIHFDGAPDSMHGLHRKKNPDEPLRRGDIVYITNDPIYPYKHLNGEGKGYMAICCSPEDQTFTSLGLPLRASREDINRKLIADFNQLPMGDDFVLPKVAQKILAACRPDFISQLKRLRFATIISEKDFLENGGGQILCSFQLDVNRLTQLARSSLEEARKLFDQWNTATKSASLK